MTTKPIIFTSETFSDESELMHRTYGEVAAEIANKIIESKLGPKVYGKELSIEWTTAMPVGATRTAYLFDIKELPKKECEHDFVEYNVNAPFTTAKCSMCKAELKAKWEVKK